MHDRYFGLICKWVHAIRYISPRSVVLDIYRRYIYTWFSSEELFGSG
jgi:hypothetical protein